MSATEIPDGLGPDPAGLTPAEAKREEEARRRLGEQRIGLTGKDRFEIEERLVRLLVELIEQRDTAVVETAKGIASSLRAAAAREGALVFRAALESTAAEVEAAALSFAARLSSRGGPTGTGAGSPP